VDRGLRSVNLHNVANKRAGQFSGGMKRRLSVAISFMGNPAIVYLDEPSTVRCHRKLCRLPLQMANVACVAPWFSYSSYCGAVSKVLALLAGS